MLPSIKTEVSTENNPSAKEALPRRLSLKKVLYHPLTWLAIGLHVVLLVVPLHDRQPVETPVEEEVAEEEKVAIDILNLSDIATSTPPPENTPPPEASAPVPPPPAAAPPPTQIVASPAPIPVGGATTQPPASQPAVTPPPATQPPAFNPAPAQRAFISGLGSLGVKENNLSMGMPLRGSFRRPENFEKFVTGTELIATAKDVRWLDDEPNDILPLIESDYAQTNITFTQLGNYGGEPLYMLSTDSQPILYISIVGLTGSSLVVMWENNPLG